MCRNLDVAQVVSRSSNLDCVTMEVRYCIHEQHTTGCMQAYKKGVSSRNTEGAVWAVLLAPHPA